MADTYQQIMNAANNAFNAYRFKESALLYEQAYRHGKQFKMLIDSFTAGTKSALCWALCGNTIRAVDLMMQMTQAVPPGVLPVDLFRLKTLWVQILLKINPDLVKLTNQIDELDALVNENPGLPQGNVPNLRRLLFYKQGRFKEALEQAELAWAKHNGIGIVKSDHAGAAVLCNLKLCNMKAAKRWHKVLTLRERKVDENVERIECRLIQRLAKIHFALCEQRYEDANVEARELAKLLDGVQFARWLSIQREFEIRTLLLQQRLGDPALHSHPALGLLKRHSQGLNTVYGVYEEFRLHIDYRLAALRFAAGMEPVDDHWYTKKQVLPQSRITPHSDLQDRILRTRRTCEKALRHAQHLDIKLQCEWRQQEVRGRLERLDEIVTSLVS